MKKVFTVAVVLAMAFMFSACGFSTDTIKYANGTDKEIQTAECVVEVLAPEPVVIPPKATRVKIMEPVLFDFDKSNIRDDQVIIIDKIADLMAEYPDTVLVIKGYASTEGPDKYNMALSQRRANSVKTSLIEKGVPADRIVDSIGKGEVGIFGELLKLNRRAVVLDIK